MGMSSVGDLGFSSPVSALVLGARGGIGEAFVRALLTLPDVSAVAATSRSSAWVAEDVSDPRESRFFLDLENDQSIDALGEALVARSDALHLVINCTGLLHDTNLRPERSWRHIEREAMQRCFDVHATGLALLLAAVMPSLPRDDRAVFASLSARVGSIGDNRLGGWFSYRASKAAQNMILKTASLEAARKWPLLTIAALHPGTVESALSEPFVRGGRSPYKVFTPEYSVEKLLEVIAGLTPADTGCFRAWDGSEIQW